MVMTENKRFTYSDVWGWNIDGFLNTMNGLDRKNNELKERIKELEKENEKIRQEIKKETDRVIKLEQYVYTKLCPQSEHYDEKVLSELINTILGDVE